MGLWIGQGRVAAGARHGSRSRRTLRPWMGEIPKGFWAVYQSALDLARLSADLRRHANKRGRGLRPCRYATKHYGEGVLGNWDWQGRPYERRGLGSWRPPSPLFQYVVRACRQRYQVWDDRPGLRLVARAGL